MIYLLTAIGLTPGGSSTVHSYTQNVHRTTQITNLEECGLIWCLYINKSFHKELVRAFPLEQEK